MAEEGVERRKGFVGYQEMEARQDMVPRLFLACLLGATYSAARVP